MFEDASFFTSSSSSIKPSLPFKDKFFLLGEVLMGGAELVMCGGEISLSLRLQPVLPFLSPFVCPPVSRGGRAVASVSRRSLPVGAAVYSSSRAMVGHFHFNVTKAIHTQRPSTKLKVAATSCGHVKQEAGLALQTYCRSCSLRFEEASSHHNSRTETSLKLLLGSVSLFLA